MTAAILGFVTAITMIGPLLLDLSRDLDVPLGQAGLLAAAMSLPWALAAAVLAPSAWLAAAPIAIYLAARLWMAWTIGARGLEDDTVRRRWILIPVYDALATCVSVIAFCVNRVEWRGRRFKMRSGRLVPIG